MDNFKITDEMRETIKNHLRFKTLNIAIELQINCIKEFKRLGISDESLSFMGVGMERITAELKEAEKYAKYLMDNKKIDDEFKRITDGMNIKDDTDPKTT